MWCKCCIIFMWFANRVKNNFKQYLVGLLVMSELLCLTLVNVEFKLQLNQDCNLFCQRFSTLVRKTVPEWKTEDNNCSLLIISQFISQLLVWLNIVLWLTHLLLFLIVCPWPVFGYFYYLSFHIKLWIKRKRSWLNENNSWCHIEMGNLFSQPLSLP